MTTERMQRTVLVHNKTPQSVNHAAWAQKEVSNRLCAMGVPVDHMEVQRWVGHTSEELMQKLQELERRARNGDIQHVVAFGRGCLDPHIDPTVLRALHDALTSAGGTLITQADFDLLAVSQAMQTFARQETTHRRSMRAKLGWAARRARLQRETETTATPPAALARGAQDIPG